MVLGQKQRDTFNVFSQKLGVASNQFGNKTSASSHGSTHSRSSHSDKPKQSDSERHHNNLSATHRMLG